MSLISCNTNKKILVVAAHPDDEVLGCGGTIARYVREGHDVYVVFMTDGVSSRKQTNIQNKIKNRKKSAILASQILGIKLVEILDFPDNGMDTVPILDIVQNLEAVIDKVKPSIVFTHYWGDLNIDHRVTCQSVLTACRPYPAQVVKEIYSFEIPSSTEWSSPSVENNFNPNNFVDISKTIELKMSALQAYDQEMRNFPHSRSLKAINSLAKVRGAAVGIVAAECFVVIRQTI
jgi:N-acetylglucosamine malate deacetylase 1